MPLAISSEWATVMWSSSATAYLARSHWSKSSCLCIPKIRDFLNGACWPIPITRVSCLGSFSYRDSA